MRKRIQRVNTLIKREIGQIILREVDFPEDTLVTISRVETSVNLNQAEVYVSVMPEGQSDRIIQILNRQIYELQQELNKRLKMRPIPRIEFKKEEKTEEAARVEEILEEIKEDES